MRKYQVFREAQPATRYFKLSNFFQPDILNFCFSKSHDSLSLPRNIFLRQVVYMTTFKQAISHGAGFCISAGWQPCCCNPSPQRGLCAPDSSNGTGLQLCAGVHSPPCSVESLKDTSFVCAVLTKQRLTHSAVLLTLDLSCTRNTIFAVLM